jgi:UDP-glucose 4-epimerase
MSTVLVTGGSGVNGPWVLRSLVEKGISVVNYDSRKDTSLYADISHKVETLVGDILDLPHLIDAIKRYHVDRIVHLAAIMPDPLESNPYSAYRVNVDGTINILEAARLMNIKRVVYTSSVAVYAPVTGEYGYPTYKPVGEDYPQVPQSVYGATKLFTEHMCFNYQRIYGVDFVILRFSWIYGPGKQARHGVLALHSKIIESAMIGQPIKIPQGGDEKVDSVYCRDVGQGVALACVGENLQHRVFNIGTGRGETFRQLIDALHKMLGKVPVEIGPGLDPRGTGGPGYMVMDIERAKKELGYRPQYDLEAGAKDYIESMKRLGIKPMAVT